MYCQNCGNKASGSYCSICGAKLIFHEQINETRALLPWREERDIVKIINNPEVRAMIANSTQQSMKHLSAEEFLNAADKLINPISPGVSLKKIAEVVVPIFREMGISTGKSEEKIINLIISEAIVKTICAMAKNGYPLTGTEQGNNGVLLVGKISSDLWTWGGDLLITIEERDHGTSITINTKIAGQLYDWGKSRRIIDRISFDIENMELIK